MKRKRIVVMGFMGSMPIAGVIWQHVHYIVGLERLGHDVYYVEDSARIPYNPQTFDTNNDFAYAADVLGQLAREFGFERHWGFCARYLPDHPTAGIRLTKIRQLYREVDAILNVCGTQEFNDDLLQSERILYVESDPGVEQTKVDQSVRSTIDYLGKHRVLFTFGENIGTDRFPVPLHKLKWLPTRQPVVTDLWKTNRAPAATAVFTSIANWSTSGLKDIEWHGEKYLWSKSREFLRFVAAPKRSGEPFELATDIKEEKTREKFLRNGWRFREPHEMSVDYWQYRDYIRRSKGEFTVAKDQYVRLTRLVRCTAAPRSSSPIDWRLSTTSTRSSCWSMVGSSRVDAGPSWWRGAAPMRNSTPPATIHPNEQRKQRPPSGSRLVG